MFRGCYGIKLFFLALDISCIISNTDLIMFVQFVNDYFVAISDR